MENNQLHHTPLSEWFEDFKKPFVISGPCSAESEEQMLATAKGVASNPLVRVLRAGIWKPRTRPNQYEGAGEKGLSWLVNAGKEVQLKTATEVANAQHTEASLKAGVDILWIGARSSVSPFVVQEIADSLKGVDVPVFVKNPINPDIKLWVGALERLRSAGIHRLAAIHRGFSSFEKSVYRNVPNWEIPIELKRQMPNLDIICDPSHIAGNRELLTHVSQKALDLDMSGLMIEAHISPDTALSDAEQQLTPGNLSKLLNALNIRSAHSINPESEQRLLELRSIIDELDEVLLQKLGARMEVVQQIGSFKKAHDITIFQLERWKEILASRKGMQNETGLNEAFIQTLMELIHKESIRKQTEILNNSSQK